MKILRRINLFLYRFQKRTLVVLFFVLLALASAQVLLRIFFKAGIENADSVTRFLVLWIGFLGASLATYKNRHINIDILSQFMNLKGNRVIGAVVNGVALVTCAFLLKASVLFISDEIAYSSSLMGIPVWVLELALPVTFFFMSMRFLQSFLENIMGKKT